MNQMKQQTSQNPQADSQQNTGNGSVRLQALEGKYQHFVEIGHGAQGRIFRATRREDGKTVVIKQLCIHSVKTWKEYELFQRESAVLASLNMNGVARFYEAVECLDDATPAAYIVEEFIEGRTLQDMLNAGERLDMNVALDILIQTLQILAKLHSHKPPIIHRDIKPSNLMLTPAQDGSFRVTVIDFGAVANPQLQGGGSTVAGTYGYMPPEQLTGKPVAASDIYAVAAVGVYLFSGIAPGDLPVRDFRLIFEPKMQDRPHELVSLLGQMLNPRVNDRLSDIPAIINMLEAIRNGEAAGISGNRQYAKDYEIALASVDKINTPGCVSLWQRLPDRIPRHIPKCYVNVTARLSTLTTFMSRRKNTGALIVMLCISFMYLIPSAIATWMQQYNYPIVTQQATWWMSLFICGGLGFILIIIGLAAYFSKKSESFTTVPRTILTLHNWGDMSHANLMRNLISCGRKTIATITNITYLPAIDSNLLHVKSANEIAQCPPNQYFTPAPGKPLVNLGNPDFMIIYRFNPPDDLRKEDIFHKCVVHAVPDFKIGDTMPILYTITRLGEGDDDIVTSMPFPFPASDNPVELIDRSSGHRCAL